MMPGFIEYEHWSHVPPKVWKWPHFPPQEIACRGTGRIKVSVDAMDALQRLRSALGAPMILQSAYRSPEHNAKVGGAKNSYHMQGLAFDVSMQNHDPQLFAQAAATAGFHGIGWYPPKKGNFIHVDIGPSRTWGTPWKAARFDAEAKDKRPGKAVGIAALTSAGTAAFQAVNPDTLRQVQEVVTPMIAYAPIFQGVFAACGFGLVGWLLWDKFVKKAP